MGKFARHLDLDLPSQQNEKDTGPVWTWRAPFPTPPTPEGFARELLEPDEVSASRSAQRAPRTGRTKAMLLNALDEQRRGGKVLVVVTSRVMEKYAVRMLREKLGARADEVKAIDFFLPHEVERGVLGRQYDEAYVDHAIWESPAREVEWFARVMRDVVEPRLKHRGRVPPF